MNPIYENLYQFTQYRREINLSTHQYLLLNSRPCLVHTGTAEAARGNIPALKELLNGRPLCYILASHLGADECGGLYALWQEWPDAEVLCSEQTARQLAGFGFTGRIRAVGPDDTVSGDDFRFSFLDYPCEAHLRSGILAYEETGGIFFSSDLMMRAGESAGEVDTSNWKDEVNATGARQVPNHALLRQLRHALTAIKPRFVAVGHGACLKLKDF